MQKYNTKYEAGGMETTRSQIIKNILVQKKIKEMSSSIRGSRGLQSLRFPPSIPLGRIKEEEETEGVVPVEFTAACKERIRGLYQQGQECSENCKLRERECGKEIGRLTNLLEQQRYELEERHSRIITERDAVIEQLTVELDECRNEVTGAINELFSGAKSLLMADRAREIMKNSRYYKR